MEIDFLEFRSDPKHKIEIHLYLLYINKFLLPHLQNHFK